jgi:hypothetical protein
MFSAAQYANFHWLLCISFFGADSLFWLIVLSCATMAHTTKTYKVHPDEPEDAKWVFEKIANTKQRWLMCGLYILMAALVLFVDIYLFLWTK